MNTPPSISPDVLTLLRRMQRNEVTEQLVYARIAARVKNEKNKATLLHISAEEGKHAAVLARLTGETIAPSGWRAAWFSGLARVFGFTFAVKLMEQGESAAMRTYAGLQAQLPDVAALAQDEEKHEAALLEMLEEERLNYVGAMVLGLNDALVELTGTLAGMTFALANTRLVALSGLITGIAATLSMASSQFLSARAEGRTDALKSCAYTGAAYLFAVTMLVIPYLVLPNHLCWVALAWMLVHVVVIIAAFNFYLSVAKGGSFRQRFGEMAGVSLGVAVISFGVGLAVKYVLGVDLD